MSSPEMRPARHSSGWYDPDQQGLRGDAAPMAGAIGDNGLGNRAVGPPPVDDRPFYKKRWFIIMQLILVPLGIALLFIVLFPVLKAIVQLVVNKADMGVSLAQITQPTNGSFQLSLVGDVTHTSIFNSVIQFPDPVNVTWVEDDGTQTPLGLLPVDTLYGRNKHAIINQTTLFQITNEDAFGRFATHMITAQNFTWRIQSDTLVAQALKFPKAKGIKFDKSLTLNGFNSFNGDVKLASLELPSDNPAGGINFVAVTTINNPSPFSISLGTVEFALSYNNTNLGTGKGTNTVIVPGVNNISLSGYMQHQANPDDLASLSVLFTNFINGDSSPVFAKGLSTVQNDGTSIPWLSTGIQGLTLEVPFQSAEPINPINSIDIGSLAFAFTPETAWAPHAQSNSVRASMSLPFGFNIAIGQIQNDFNISKNGLTVAGLSTPLGASTSNVAVHSSTNTTGTIDITIDTNANCPDPDHPNFSWFTTNITGLKEADFRLIGNSIAVANTSAGMITLNPIKVNISTSLLGLQGLQGFTTINSVDVTGGTTEGIELAIDLDIYNPANIKLATGDLTLQMFRETSLLGTATMPNLTLNIGNNSLAASAIFQANANALAGQTLNDFVGKKNTSLSIAGYGQSTQVESLAQAMKTLNLNVDLPGLTSNLLNSASLEVLPTTGATNNISHVSVQLSNPFTAGLSITHILSNVSAYGITLGTLEQDTQFSAPGKQTTSSPTFDLNMNMDPASLFTVTRALVVDAGMDPAPLDAIVKLGGISYLNGAGSSRSLSERNLFTGFNLVNYVDQAFKSLKSDVDMSAAITIGDYSTNIQLSQTGVPTVTDSSLNLILPILARPIVQQIITAAALNIDTVMITNPQETQFQAQMKGSVTNAGPFDAAISFSTPLNIEWNGQKMGTLAMSDLQVTGDVGAPIDQTATFQVADVGVLTSFSKVLLTEESFEWTISADNLSVSAMGITITNVAFPPKTITLSGFNGLKGGVKINSFDLPANDPAGGIHLTLDTSITNPSQVGIAVDSLGFNSFAGSVLIAPVTSAGAVSLAPKSTVSMSLVGRLIPQTTPEGLAAVSQVMNNYIHGQDTTLTVDGSSVSPGDVTWLSTAIQSLSIETIMPNNGTLNLMKSVSLNELQMLFTQDTAYAPPTSSDNTEAAFTLPFAFPIDIVALEQNITVGYQGTDFAVLSCPKAPSTTDVEARIIHLTFANVPFAVFDNQHNTFNDFLAATTMGSSETLALSGVADIDASTAVGLLSLTQIVFNVDSTIQGLRGLDTKPVTVSNLDVVHGYADYLELTLETGLWNPSNLTIGTGDVNFAMQFQGQTIGQADINNLTITPGNLTVPTDVHYQPQGSDQVAAGLALLANFLQGVDSDATIMGASSSTPIESLQEAMSDIKFSPVVVPALHQNLITSASLVFPENIAETGIAQASFSMSNPFTATLNLLKVGATAYYHGVSLGVIDHVDVSANPIVAPGHSNITSSTLPMKFNMNPVAIIELILTAAQTNNVDLGPLLPLLQEALADSNLTTTVTTAIDPNPATCSSGQQFDFDGAILAALKGLLVTLAVDTYLKIDDYALELVFNQTNVPAITDQTALYLIGPVAAPIAQNLVNGAVLNFTSATIENITESGFDLALDGSLTNIGPLDALINFIEPLEVNWQGNKIATIELPPVCASANVGVPKYTPSAHLTITDAAQFTTFATFMLENPSFEWTISTPNLELTALGTIFSNVSLSKDISFKGFNGLPGVTISSFALPGDAPSGGIIMDAGAEIPSQSQIAIELGEVAFTASFDDVVVGSLSGNNLFLAAEAVTAANLSGVMVPQTGSALDTMGVLFSNFLAGNDQTLSIKGNTVQPPGASAPVQWLSDAFQQLTMMVVLPGQKLSVINSIDLADLEIILNEQSENLAPLTSSSSSSALYQNPFGFSLQVIEAGENITLGSSGFNLATLQLPSSPVTAGVSTGQPVEMAISFDKLPLTSLNDELFPLLFAAVTLSSSTPVELSGSANVIAKTPIGNVPISGIPFDVTSNLIGINDFGGQTTLSNLSVSGSGGAGGNQFVVAPATVAIKNPSNISLQTNDVSLPVSYQGVVIGRASLDTFNLVPGANTMAAEFHYAPDNANDTVAQSFLTEFLLTGDNIPVTVDGDAQSTPYSALSAAIGGVQLSATVPGLDVPPIVTHITVVISLDTLATNMVVVNCDLANPLDTPLVITFVQSDAGVGGQNYAHFDQAFSGITLPPKGTGTTGDIPNVLLTQGVLASLPIIPLGELDVEMAITLNVGSASGYQIPWLQVTQKSVPTTYNLNLGALSLNLDPFSLEEVEQKITQLFGSASTSAAHTSSSLTLSSLLSSGASHSTTSASTSSTASTTTTTSVQPTASSHASTNTTSIN